jgi:hypothetical protein
MQCWWTFDFETIFFFYNAVNGNKFVNKKIKNNLGRFGIKKWSNFSFPIDQNSTVLL